MSTPTGTTDLLDAHMPVYDVALTEHLVIAADVATTYRAVRDLDFLTVRSPLLLAAMAVRGLPDRIRGRAAATPERLLLTSEDPGLEGWVRLGAVRDHAVAFGAVGTFWTPQIVWHEVSAAEFLDFASPGWGKIACQLLVRADGPDRTVVTYECRTGTTDAASRRQMGRYWWMIRPFVSHILRATLAQIGHDAQR